jgi:signal transduction histidine kinase
LRGYSDIDQNALKMLEFSLANDDETGVLATVVKTNQSAFVSDISTLNTSVGYAGWDFIRKYDVKSFIAAPISFENEVYGIITVGRIGTANELANNDKELLTNVARQFAAAFKNAIAHTQLQATNATLERKVAERTMELIAARDEAIRAYQVKSLFLASMSHELRTPLNAIIGYSDMLREAALEDGLEEYLTDLTRIESNGQHLLALINEILNFSKMESGNSELTIEPFSLLKVLEDMEAIVIPLARENTNRLTIVNNLCDARLHGDAQKLKQILVNIVGNACKFTKNGRVDVHVTETGSLDKQWIIIAVSDTGIGIDPVHLEHLFTAFYQGEDPLTKSHGGTGLGLAICQRFSMMMGGDINVKSAVGQGSTFTITIPRNLFKPSNHDLNFPIECQR